MTEDLADVLAAWRKTQPKEPVKEKKERVTRKSVDPETKRIADKLTEGVSLKELIPWLKTIDDEFTDPKDDDEVDELIEQIQEDMELDVVSGEGMDSVFTYRTE